MAALRRSQCTTLRTLLLEKGTFVYGHKSGQPPSCEDAVREARGREIGPMADHGMCDIVA